MKRASALKHEFVEFIPESLQDGTIYISIQYATSAHKCCCGCGKEVITPLTPTDWKLIFDGETISLEPSIGNWEFDCKSHYWIRRNRVKWAPRWSQTEIDTGRAFDQSAKTAFYNKAPTDVAGNENELAAKDIPPQGWWQRFTKRKRKPKK